MLIDDDDNDDDYGRSSWFLRHPRMNWARWFPGWLSDTLAVCGWLLTCSFPQTFMVEPLVQSRCALDRIRLEPATRWLLGQNPATTRCALCFLVQITRDKWFIWYPCLMPQDFTSAQHTFRHLHVHFSFSDCIVYTGTNNSWICKIWEHTTTLHCISISIFSRIFFDSARRRPNAIGRQQLWPFMTSY